MLRCVRLLKGEKLLSSRNSALGTCSRFHLCNFTKLIQQSDCHQIARNGALERATLLPVKVAPAVCLSEVTGNPFRVRRCHAPVNFSDYRDQSIRSQIKMSNVSLSDHRSPNLV